MHLLNINISKFFPFSAELTETRAIIWPGGHFPLCPPTALSPGTPCGSTWTAGRGHTGCPTADSGKSGSSGVRSAALDSPATEKNKIKESSYEYVLFNKFPLHTTGRFLRISYCML